MDENWLAESDGEEDTVPTAGLGYDEQIWIAGVRISPYDCPDCLEREEFDCFLCEFFTPETCQLRRNPFLMRDFRTLLDLYRERRAIYLERRAAQLRHQQELIRAVRSELGAHGRPLHYTVLARMVSDRHPDLQVSEYSVLRIMASHPNTFERVAEGVYRCQQTNQH